MLLEVEDLHTDVVTPDGPLHAVVGVSFTLAPGRTLALVGESGCGKSLTALSILRLLPPGGRVIAGHIRFDGRDLLRASEPELCRLRGRDIAMIFQEPQSSLNPLLKVGVQVDEVLRWHKHLPRRVARQSGVELLRRVGLPDPERRYHAYPHELSGGMRQRVLIAAALACEPRLLIADEPTTALDVTVQAQILTLLADLQQRTGLALLLITHDLGVVAQMADTVCVMYAGQIVERGATEDILRAPQHPYTCGLLRSLPRLTAQRTGGPLPVIPGEVPSPAHRPAGCAFQPRCALGGDDPTCRTHAPPLLALGENRQCACWRAPGYPAAEARRCVVGLGADAYNAAT